MAKNMKQLREAVGLTQKQVANKTNKTETYISLLENGNRNPSDKLKKELANLYGVSISEIFLALELTKC
jgi:transcriptional regulator with XRE-family HTH domain